MKNILITILSFAIYKVALCDINNHYVNNYFGLIDTVETTLLEIKSEDYIYILNQIDSMIDHCLFSKKNNPNFKTVYLKGNGLIYISVNQGYNLPISFYEDFNDKIVGVYLFNNSYHTVYGSTYDSIFNKIFVNNRKIKLTNEFTHTHIYKPVSNNNRNDDFLFEIKIINNKFVINDCRKCIESEEYLPLIPIGEIDYINKKTNTFRLILNSSLSNDTCTGYAFLNIEFNNLKQMKVVNINSINFIRIYECNDVIVDLNYYEELFIGGHINSSINLEVVNEIKEQMKLNIKDLNFFVPKRYKWYNKIFPSKTNNINAISKNENVMVYFIIIPNKKVP